MSGNNLPDDVSQASFDRAHMDFDQDEPEDGEETATCVHGVTLDDECEECEIEDIDGL